MPTTQAAAISWAQYLVPYVVIPLASLLGLLVFALCAWAVYQTMFGPVIVRTLVTKYLRKRRIAWVSLIAVTLCTAMVLVVISVMGGWLENFKAKFRGMSGDIVAYRTSVTGFGGYEDMLAKIKAMPEVTQAVPLIRTFGLLNVNNRATEAVSVTGVDLDEYSGFNQFRESLFRQYQEHIQDGSSPPPKASFKPWQDPLVYQMLTPRDEHEAERPGIIIGGPIFGIRGNAKGKTEVDPFFYDLWCKLQVVPMATDQISITDLKPATEQFWVTDISRTKLFQLDDKAVYVPFDVLQQDLNMTPQPYQEMVGDKLVDRVRPARCSEIQINLRPGVDRMAMVARIDGIVQTIAAEEDPSTVASLSPIHVEPWEKQQESFLGAVENEKSLLTFLLGLISLVAIFLIFCILYMIVVEKTRDIGIIKSVGATSQGIAAIFLSYGLAIGVVGGVCGLLAGWGIMTWINEIHSVIAAIIGKPIWDPEIYAFDKIPDKVDPTTAAVVFAVAVLSAVIGAVVPAIRAGRQDPIEALRFE